MSRGVRAGHQPATASGDPEGRVLIAVTVLASFVAFLDGSVVNLALPAISADLGGGLTLQQWVVDGYLLALGALILVAGAVSDALGRLAVLRAGLVVFAAASMLCALAPSGPLLVAARCVQGVGAAFLVPSSLAMINERFSGAEQARAVGIWTAWTGTAFVVGPVLGGVLVDTLDWRWIFAINLPPLILTLYLTTRLPTPPRPAGRGLRDVDGFGAVLTALGLTGAVFALIEQQRLGPWHPMVVGAFVLGICCLAVFPFWERRARHPMMPLEIFHSRNFAVANAATVFLYAGVSLGMLTVTLFLMETAALSATAAGLATLPIPVLSFFLAARFGALAGRHGPRWYMAAGPLLAAAGFALMTGVRVPFDFWTQLLPGLVLFAVGLSMTVTPLTATVLAAVDAAHSGIGSAVNNAVSRVAGLIAIAFMSVIVGGTIDFAGFQRAAVVTSALFAVAGLISAAGIRNQPPGEVPALDSARCLDRGR
ncbi:MFS transporter [Mycobacterium sp. MS1601]|uniref:MFS transporter n=1 Tax=Mycobacterium sp. MS1601 TaxID=1936029 RepID=UPI0009791157|nr:MFS transporter [Mycobacterium sp. MS1601]AQA05826.1 MFS transporter [Mycobacterium sp. MS1601]